MWHLQKRGEVRREGHVALTGERRGTYIALVEKPYVDKEHGRFRCR
jgi:hypothetical protein